MRLSKTVKISIGLGILFIVFYVATLSCVYPNTLRMIEANCWVDDYVWQFFRWPMLGAMFMCSVIVGVMLGVGLLLRLCHLGRFMPICIVIGLVLAYLFPPMAEGSWGEERLFSKTTLEKEDIYKYQFMADAKVWDDLKQTIINDGNANSVIGIRYLLLCESALGTLAENLFRYPISETEHFLFRGSRNTISCTFNRQFYENIGIWDECYHQAQEYSMCLDNFCLQSICQMVDYSIKEAEWQVAEKLLTVLEQTLFYGNFVRERREEIAKVRKQKPVSDAPLRQDNFVTVYSMQNELVHDFQYQVGDSMKIQEYIMCCMLIRKRLSQFCSSLSILPRYQCDMEHLPMTFREAIDIYNSKGEAHRDGKPGTYAHFFYNVQIPEMETRFGASMTN